MASQPTKTSSRKKFLLWTAAVFSSVGVLKLLPRPKNKNAGTAAPRVKMLTQDGRLVEVDQQLLASSNKKVTKEELQQWIKK